MTLKGTFIVNNILVDFNFTSLMKRVIINFRKNLAHFKSQNKSKR